MCISLHLAFSNMSVSVPGVKIISFVFLFRQRLRRTVKIVDRLLAEDDLDMDGLIRQELQPIQ